MDLVALGIGPNVFAVFGIVDERIGIVARGHILATQEFERFDVGGRANDRDA